MVQSGKIKAGLGAYVMHLPDVVQRALWKQPECGAIEWGLYMHAWSAAPQTLTQLAKQAGMGRNTTQRACARLAQGEWMRLVRHRAGIMPVPWIPAEYQAKMAEQLDQAYDMAMYRGEFLMRSGLDLLVASNEYVDNARPGILVNPITQERLEYDRLYLPFKVAFEFNGPQHYQTTPRYDSERSIRETKNRDMVKKGLSLDAGIGLVVVTAEQLHPQVLSSLIPDVLPRRVIDAAGPYYQALVRLCDVHLAAARKQFPR